MADKSNEAYERWQHWYEPSDFMTLEQFVTRVRKDLNDPDLTFYDTPVPRNEEEYQQELKLFKVAEEQFQKKRK
ncbi:hypothetical protein HWN39_10495 [Lactobacillus rhamnosus]|uniref:Uncharacterized protein n=1 Tax=Lacticaseibacillus rhamnosus TaxID=47715 RepID=A0A7Y7QGU3_LACRH|nr:hypothetical protein [Lacticaseibacillus rhamnosus]NVO88907.1 hypothetical protein [Lacticaseibacillus rhamnosus]